MEMSNLPRDLEEKIFAKLPLTSMRAMRLTCKEWNNLFNSRSFAEKHIGEEAARENMVIVVMKSKVYLMEVNLGGIYNNIADPLMKLKGKLTCLDDSNRLEIFKVFHSEGLLLCMTKESLVVCNPYLGQTRSIGPRNPNYFDSYAIGYEEKKKSRCHKILRIFRFWDSQYKKQRDSEYEIYDMNCNSWRNLGTNPDIKLLGPGVPVKGNAYFLAGGKRSGYDGICVIGFDFTSESFGPYLRFPFEYRCGDTIALSSVREEKVAVLYNPVGSSEIEIWITSKVNPNTVLWSNFLAVDYSTLFLGFSLCDAAVSFSVDERKNTALVIDEFVCSAYRKAYILRVDGAFRQVDLTEVKGTSSPPLMCSYVPSFVHIKQSVGGKRKQITD